MYKGNNAEFWRKRNEHRQGFAMQ